MTHSNPQDNFEEFMKHATNVIPKLYTSAGTRVPNWITNTPAQAEEFRIKMDEYNKKLWTIYNA